MIPVYIFISPVYSVLYTIAGEGLCDWKVQSIAMSLYDMIHCILASIVIILIEKGGSNLAEEIPD